jgi:hypothetical protein
MPFVDQAEHGRPVQTEDVAGLLSCQPPFLIHEANLLRYALMSIEGHHRRLTNRAIQEQQEHQKSTVAC